MLNWSLTFLVLAIVAAVFGFGGIASGAVEIARVLFLLFLVMFVVSIRNRDWSRPFLRRQSSGRVCFPKPKFWASSIACRRERPGLRVSG